MDFMNAYIEQRRRPESEPRFDAPGNIVFVSVDKSTGAPALAGATGGISEAFIAGTEPGASPFPRLP
jgi:membrane carboxypeptidase/penicillin-binding protein